MATQTLLANRAYDHLYDTTYHTSHHNDHYRQTNKAMFAPGRIARVPDDKYMFSELPHYPRHTIQLTSKQELPEHVGTGWTHPDHKPVGSDASQVYGKHRHKFFARPNKQMLSTLPHIVMYAMKNSGQGMHPDAMATAAEPPTKTVGTQSVYRESEVQTDPYSPDYYIAPNQVPEVLTLTNLTFAAGLPATEAELQIIERTRQKRLFMQMLPPPTDESNLDLRLQLMEMQEFREWADRERQIKELQEKRLTLLQTALNERDSNREVSHSDKVERLRQKKEEERDRFLAGCQRERTKVLRKMEKERRAVEQRGKKKDVITEHADFTSQVYAPLARHGHVPDYSTAKIEVQPADLTTFPGIVQLEKSLNPSLLRATDKHPKEMGKTTKSSYQIRKDLEMTNALKSAMDGIKKELSTPENTETTMKGTLETTVGATGGIKNKHVRNILDRPDSPRLKEEVLPDEEEQEAAVLLLQRVIRGRAYQNKMFEGKEKRLDLINELRAAERYADTSTTVEEKRYADQLKQKAYDGVLESIQGSVISQTLDQLSKELLRFQQERRIAAMVKLAERDRQLRQAQESGRRQAEERLREREDEMFRQIMGVHQGTVDSYLEDVLTNTVEQAAQSRALTEARLKAAKINQVVDTLEASEQDPEVVVRELVHSFALPHVQREVVQRRVAVENKRFSEAASSALDESYKRVQHNLQDK